MKRSGLCALLLGLLFLVPVFAQEGNERKGEEPDSNQPWRIANFVILAGGLGYLIAKHGGPFFDGRGRKIREELVQGEEARKEAERRSAEVDKRLANLESDIAKLRAESRREGENEVSRMREETAAELAKIRVRGEQDIAAAGKTARAELKRYSAELAIGIAEQKIRSRMNGETQDALVGSFLGEVEEPPTRERVN